MFILLAQLSDQVADTPRVLSDSTSILRTVWEVNQRCMHAITLKADNICISLYFYKISAKLEKGR